MERTAQHFVDDNFVQAGGVLQPFFGGDVAVHFLFVVGDVHDSFKPYHSLLLWFSKARALQ